MKKISRQIAYEILYEVKYNKAYSNITLNYFLESHVLTGQDKGFITELVYGTLSRILFLDQMIRQYAHIPLRKLSKSTLLLLEMGVYQLMFMDGVADFAGVNETVDLVKKMDFRGTKFANGVLRSLVRALSKQPEKEKSDLLDLSEIAEKRTRLSIEFSVSEYLAGRFLRQYGEDFARKLLTSFYESPSLYIRANPLKTTSEELEEKLTSLGVGLYKIPDMSGVYSAKNLKGIGQNPYFRQGFFSVQDLSSMKAVLALDPRPGEKVLDLCSAPGGKSFFVAERMSNQGVLHAVDISANKLRLLEERRDQMGLSMIETQVGDGQILDEKKIGFYDRVLVDAPCSGFGILRRKPEIRYKGYEEVKDLPEIQEQILNNAACYLKPGGRLVYSTCTLEKKENNDQIQCFLDKHPEFALMEEPKELYPHVHGCDGFFISTIRKER